MKKIGIIGGLSPESTISYYDGIIDAFRPSYESSGFPEILINSLDLKHFTHLAQTGNWSAITKEIALRCERLKEAGADFGAIASNTPHKVFDNIAASTSLPLISIVEATKEFAIRKNFTKLILLGTAFTMSSTFYQDIFKEAGISLITPSAEEQKYIHSKIFSEMVLGIF
jgi:aspartate racemase